MQVSLETTQGLERRITITIPGKDIEQDLQKRLKSLAKTTRISGFRPGKVPVTLVQSRYGAQVRKDVMGGLVNSALEEALAQEKLRLVNYPLLEPLPEEEGSSTGDLRYTATFEIYPKVELASLAEVTINRPKVLISDDDVNLMLDHFRRQHQTWTPTNRPAVLGDRVRVDFTGTLADGTDFSGSTGNDVLIVLGSGVFVEGFEQHLLGAAAEEAHTVEVTFPPTYHQPAIAGKPARFKVTIKSVESAQLPELNETFIRQAFGITGGTIEDTQRLIREGMERDFEGKVWQLLKTQILSALYQHNPIDLPKILIEDELAQLRAKLPKDAPSSPELEEQARRHVALGIILGEIARHQRLKVDQKRVRTYIRSVAEDYNNPGEAERWYLSDKNRLQEVEALVLEDMVVEWLMGQVQIKSIPTPFSSLVGSVQTGQMEKRV